jgi:hypothetical protein
MEGGRPALFFSKPAESFSHLGVVLEYVAPSLIPMNPGDRVKTERRDATMLARSSSRWRVDTRLGA